MRMVKTVLAAVLMAGGLVGCGAVSGVDDPRAELTAISLQEQTQFGARVDLVVTLTNPNDVPLPITRADYNIDVAGVGTFSYADEPHRTIPANGTQVVRLPAAFASSGGDLSGVGASASGSITYEPPGEIRKLFTDAKVPLPSADFSGSMPVQ